MTDATESTGSPHPAGSSNPAVSPDPAVPAAAPNPTGSASRATDHLMSSASRPAALDAHHHADVSGGWLRPAVFGAMDGMRRSEEHTSELQSLRHLVCR